MTIEQASPIHCLRHAGFSDGVPAPITDAMARMCVAVQLKRGNVAYMQDEPATGFFVVLAGSLDLVVSGRGKRAYVATVSSGHVLGLGETIAGGAYASTAVANEDVALLFIERDKFLELMKRSPQLCLTSALVVSRGLEQAYKKQIALHHG